VGRFDQLVLPPHATGIGSRLDPRWKLAAAMVAVCCTLTLRTVWLSLLALFASLALALVARVPARWFGERLGVAFVAVGLFALPLPFLIDDAASNLFIGPLRFSLHGAAVAALLATRALTVVSITLVLAATTPVDALLKAARSLGIPGLLIQICLMTYRYLFVLAEELQRLRMAVRVRGFRNRPSRHAYATIGQVAGTLLVRGHERAERVHQAMVCRGFDGRFRSLTAFRTRLTDVVVFLVIAGCAAGLAVADRVVF
jgi:cobalt/nickel transport system permease protein